MANFDEKSEEMQRINRAHWQKYKLNKRNPSRGRKLLRPHGLQR
jgi:hypothetical protein